MSVIGVATGFVAIYLYHRVAADEVLDNDLRAAILDVVRDDPGVTLSDVAARLDVATNTVIYHARILEDHGHLAARRGSKYTRLFTGDARDRRVRSLVAMLRRSGKGDILRVLRHERGLRIAEIARRLDRHRSTVQEHADALEEAGLVRTNGGEGRCLEIPGDVLEAWEALDG